MEDEHHQHLVRKETRTSYPAEEVSSLHNTPSQNKEPTDEMESSLIEHEHHHSAQSKTTATSTTPASSMIPESINYNVNIQFDPVTPQANQLT
jgi:hypothetical protein